MVISIVIRVIINNVRIIEKSHHVFGAMKCNFLGKKESFHPHTKNESSSLSCKKATLFTQILYLNIASWLTINNTIAFYNCYEYLCITSEGCLLRGNAAAVEVPAQANQEEGIAV